MQRVTVVPPQKATPAGCARRCGAGLLEVTNRNEDPGSTGGQTVRSDAACMAATGQQWTFEDLTKETAGILDTFSGEQSAKQLFWHTLSYERERQALRLDGLPGELASSLKSLEVFASHDDVVLLYARSDGRLRWASVERLCRLQQRSYPCPFLLLCDISDSVWHIVFPDDSKKNYLRVLDLPGNVEDRLETACALAALSAVDPDDGSPVSWLEIVDRLEAFFPGTVPRLWREETIDAYIGQIRPKLRRVEEFARDIKDFPLLTRRQERGDDLTGYEVPSDGSGMDYRKWRLVVHNLRLAVHLAYEMPHGSVELEDLVQEGCIGLMTAAERYEPGRGYRFSTYAYYWIMQRMQRALEENTNLIRWPGYRVRELVRANRRGETEHLSLGERAVVPLESDEGIMEDPWHGSTDTLNHAMLKEKIDAVLRTLTYRQREIIKLRFGLGNGFTYTLDEVGRIFNLSKERVRQIEAKAVRKLKHPVRRH